MRVQCRPYTSGKRLAEIAGAEPASTALRLNPVNRTYHLRRKTRSFRRGTFHRRCQVVK